MISAELKQTLEMLAPEIDRRTVQDFINRMDDDYFVRFSVGEIRSHMKMSLDLDQEHPVRVETVPRGSGKLDLIVVAYDCFGEFSIICGLLSSFGFDIESGDVYTFLPRQPGERALTSLRKIVDVFTVKQPNLDRRLTDDEAFEKELTELVRLLRDRQVMEARDRLNRRLIEQLERVRAEFGSFAYLVDIIIDNDTSDKWTVLHVHSRNTPAFLYTFSNALAMRGIYIHKVRIESLGGEVSDRFFISDRQGSKIQSEHEQKALKMAVALIKQFTHFLPAAPDPAKGLEHFDQLLDKVLEYGVSDQTIALFSQERGLNLLANLLGSSDFLWEDFLRQRVDTLLPLLVAVAEPGPTPSKEVLGRYAADAIASAGNYADQKRVLNEFKDRQIFLIDMKHLVEPAHELEPFSESLSSLAEVVLEQAYHVCSVHLEEKYGRPLEPDRSRSSFAICGLGKLGGREMGYASDLELLFLYEGQGRTDGDQSISTGEYFERLANEIATFIEARRDGIFHIDPRLRPYGKAGDLAISIERAEAYYSAQGEAAPFERQALIKLRWVAGDQPLGRRMEQHRDSFVYSDAAWDLDSALHLRQRQVIEMVEPGRVNAKYSAGGLIDIEYGIQYLQMMHGRGMPQLRSTSTLVALDALHLFGLVSKHEHEEVQSAYRFLRQLIDGLRIVRGNSRDLVIPNRHSDEIKFLARRLGYRESEWSVAARNMLADIRNCRLKANRFFVGRFDPFSRHRVLAIAEQ